MEWSASGHARDIGEGLVWSSERLLDERAAESVREHGEWWFGQSVWLAEFVDKGQ